jgi:2-polyprenyl-6-methoxyphenol hydroxylase-like FAD-dependent oxidoreductase
MQFSSTIQPSAPRLAASVSLSDVMKLASALAKEHGLDRSAALKDAWHCFRDWEAAKVVEADQKRAAYHRRFKARKKAVVIGSRVVERFGGAFSEGSCVEQCETRSERLKRLVKAAA